MTCERWDVVVVPFPFTDHPVQKRRPALALTGSAFNRKGHTLLAMITTSLGTPWPGDVPLGGWAEAGLPKPCKVRLKLFTIDNRLLVRQTGAITADDSEAVLGELRKYLP